MVVATYPLPLQIKPCDERVLMQAVARSPVVIAMDAYCDEFMSYSGGVITFSCAPPNEHEEACKKGLDHAIAVVGYGTNEKTGKIV